MKLLQLKGTGHTLSMVSAFLLAKYQTEGNKLMLKSCSYCGKIHDSKFICEKKPKKSKRFSNQNSFRNKAIWKNKAIEIKERDMYLCRICLEEGILNSKDLEVHHIYPLEEDDTKALDNDYLLTVCRKHHELCETGKINRKNQLLLATIEPNIAPRGYMGEKN